VAEPIATATPEQETAWYDVVGKFRNAAADYDRAISTAQSYADVAAESPELKAQYDAAMSTYDTLRERIASVQQAISSAMGWFRNLFSAASPGMHGLGILPLVPIALVTATLAVVAYEARQVWTLNAKLSAAADLRRQGVPAAQAAEMVAQITGESPDSGGIVGMLIGGGNVKRLVWIGAGAAVLIGGVILWRRLAR
jgi:hypothetical protein